MTTKILIAIATLALVVRAGDDTHAEARRLFERAQSIQLTDAKPTPVENSEKGVYKIEHRDGSVTYAETAPDSHATVRALYKRTAVAAKARKVSTAGDFHSHEWVQVSSKQSREDDAVFATWMRRLAHESYAQDHKQLVAKHDGRKASDEAQMVYVEARSEVKRRLVAAGEKLGVGAALWNCEEAGLRVHAMQQVRPQHANKMRLQRRKAMADVVQKLK